MKLYYNFTPYPSKKNLSQVFQLIIAKLQKTFKKFARSAHSPHKKH